jgi:hypothetical protein
MPKDNPKENPARTKKYPCSYCGSSHATMKTVRRHREGMTRPGIAVNALARGLLKLPEAYARAGCPNDQPAEVLSHQHLGSPGPVEDASMGMPDTEIAEVRETPAGAELSPSSSSQTFTSAAELLRWGPAFAALNGARVKSWTLEGRAWVEDVEDDGDMQDEESRAPNEEEGEEDSLDPEEEDLVKAWLAELENELQKSRHDIGE